jgi:excisionase family DNA binding protein
MSTSCHAGVHTPAPLTPENSIFLTTKEASELLRVSPITMSRWRIEGSGPPYRKFGRRVTYARTDVIAWANAQIHTSTSQPANAVRP